MIAVEGLELSMDTTVLKAQLPTPLAEKIDRLAARLDRSRDWVVEQALGAWIDREERQRTMTLEGMADVDAGRFIDQSAMEAWADSLDTDSPAPAPR
jgi:predicted transcriptional regulator